MADVVVTCPARRWDEWLAEGDLAGDPPSGEQYGFWLDQPAPLILPGQRVYIVACGRLRGYAPLTELFIGWDGTFGLFREGGAVAVTIPRVIRGFRGWRNRWWDRTLEVPFPAWRERSVPCVYCNGSGACLVCGRQPLVEVAR